MSVSYTSILWNRQKKRYDMALMMMVLGFIALFFISHLLLHPTATFETILIRCFAWLALLLLHVILAIGPLSRFDRRFLIVLYNRRHLGVTMFLMAAIHGLFSMMNFHALSNMNPVRSVFLSNLRYDSLAHFPFQVLGFLALVILALMATSSHDFWLKNLGVRTWKALHMMVYLAYGLILMHVVLGGLQNEASPAIFGIVMIGFIGITSLHLMAGWKEWKSDRLFEKNQDQFIVACDLSDLEEDRAKVIALSDERVAIFKYDGKVSAISNACRHQGGPLGEGRIVDGCVTCPWHGYQYLPGNGQSPPPFTEKVETYHLKVEGTTLMIDPKPNEPGTPVAPLLVPDEK
ncbi:MAG: Rieske 2Fe-2S domain-containing protein [Bacteroidota bacterium]